jgi:hypothetical protein
MDQRLIVRPLRLKGLDATKISGELEAAFGPDSLPYSIVMSTVRSAIWVQIDSETLHSEIEDAIVQAVGKVPLASVKELPDGCAVRQFLYLVTSPNHFPVYPNIYNGFLTTWLLPKSSLGREVK